MLCQKSNFTCVENVLWCKHLFVLKQLWLSLFSCASQIKYDRIRQTLSKYNERVFFFFNNYADLWSDTSLTPLAHLTPLSQYIFMRWFMCTDRLFWDVFTSSALFCTQYNIALMKMEGLCWVLIKPSLFTPLSIRKAVCVRRCALKVKKI